MSFTSISQLTPNPDTGSIENGNGKIIPGHSFFYCEDVQKILEQAKDDPDARISQLKIVSVKFEKDHGDGNHNMHEVIGLAMEKSPELGPDGQLVDAGWYDKVALAWPPYYKPGTSTTLVDEINEDFLGQPFMGHESYLPGLEIHKI